MASPEGIQFNVDQAIAKLGELVSTHGPQAVDLAASVVQMGGVATLVQGAACAAVSLGCLLGLRAHIGGAMRREGDTFEFTIDYSPLIVLPLVLVGALTGIGAVVRLTDVWAWVALFNPKLALAHEVLSKVGL